MFFPLWGTQRLQMSAMPREKTPAQKSIWSTLVQNKLLIALAFVGIAITWWQLRRR